MWSVAYIVGVCCTNIMPNVCAIKLIYLDQLYISIWILQHTWNAEIAAVTIFRWPVDVKSPDHVAGLWTGSHTWKAGWPFRLVQCAELEPLKYWTIEPVLDWWTISRCKTSWFWLLYMSLPVLLYHHLRFWSIKCSSSKACDYHLYITFKNVILKIHCVKNIK